MIKSGTSKPPSFLVKAMIVLPKKRRIFAGDLISKCSLRSIALIRLSSVVVGPRQGFAKVRG